MRLSAVQGIRRTTTKVTGSGALDTCGRSLVTEGNGHIIDPAGDARRALQAAVAEHGPEALSNAVIMDGICQARLSNLPGEAILIGSAARSDVPTLLRDLIPRLGNYGAIQSVAATLADAHGLDNAACVWVVREFARAGGLIASGGTQPTSRIGPGGGAGQGAAPPPWPAGPPSAAAAGAGAGSPGGPGGPGGPGVPGGPGIPPGMAGGAGGRPPRRPSSGARVLNRNTVGIAAAIALVAGYLGVAVVAHLSPFPAKTVAATSSAPASTGNNSPSRDGSPDPTPDPDPSPTSDYQILLSKIPNVVPGANNCHNFGTPVSAIAVSECTRLQGLAAGTIFYYLFSDSAALSNGFSTFLKNEKFKKQTECTSNNNFVSFIPQCESGFTSTSPAMTGSIAEYANTSNDPIIVTTDNQQQVMAVMVGTNDGDLLAYWKQLQWVVT